MKIFPWFFLSLFISHSSLALSIYHTGSTRDVLTQTHQVTCLAGGGDDDDWADGWRYLLKNSGGGDIVIIRTGGKAGGYLSWIYDDTDHLHFPEVNSVTVLSLENARDANDPRAISVLKKAEMIFFSGGDQTLYIDWFRGSRLETETLAAISQRHVPVGGTSAGMALLAGIDYRGKYPSPSTGEYVTSVDALLDPMAPFVDLDSHVITAPFMKNVITETHFTEYDRHGRLMVFLARALHDGLSPLAGLRGLATDEGTAFCYDSTGVGRVYGVGFVYFLQPTSMPEIIALQTPLTWLGNDQAVETLTLNASSDLFDLKTWSTNGKARHEFWSIDRGSLAVQSQP
jgi:cyanophycinase-like exopeptidase